MPRHGQFTCADITCPRLIFARTSWRASVIQMRVPLVSMLVLFVLTLLAYGLASSGNALPALGVLAGATGVLVIALSLAAPLPDSLADLHTDRGFGLCPVDGHR
jgi:hypothetical protein